MENVVSVSKDELRESFIELVNLWNVSRFKKSGEPLNLSCDTKILISKIMSLALNGLAFLGNVIIDLSIGINEGIKVIAEGFGTFASLNINFTT